MISLDKIFRLSENNTSVKTETLAGVTTFLTMAYIIIVQPAVLSMDFAGKPTGLDYGAILLATCVASAVTSIFMGLYARYPIALAPGMGENFFFVTVVMSLSATHAGNAWQTALGIVFVSGFLFFLLSVFKVRQLVIDAVSPSMRSGITAGIGLFIAFIGLRNGGIIVKKPESTWIAINTHMLNADVAVFAVGLLVAAALQARRTRGAVLWGIIASALTALALGKISPPASIFGFPEIKQNAILQMDVYSALDIACIPFVIVFLFMVFFDTIGTLIGVAEQAGFIKDNKLPRASRVLIVDATGTMIGAMMGTSTVTAYIESAAGVSYGGRTGLTSVVVGLLFLLALFFGPVIGMVGQYLPITAPALVIVGAMIMKSVCRIDWDDYSESIPAFLIAICIPLTFSIADGLALGFILYPIIKLLAGKGRQTSWLMYVLSVILILYFIKVRINLP